MPTTLRAAHTDVPPKSGESPTVKSKQVNPRPLYKLSENHILGMDLAFTSHHRILTPRHYQSNIERNSILIRGLVVEKNDFYIACCQFIVQLYP